MASSYPNPTERTTRSHRATETVKAAVDVVHGMGENIRGTFLGAIDSLAKGDTSRNDEIAWKGKAEMDRGLSVLRGNSSDRHSVNPSHTAWQGQQAAGYGGQTTRLPEPHVDNGFPRHHREDAITGVPSPQLRELQGTNPVPGSAGYPQAVNPTAAPPTAGYRPRHVEDPMMPHDYDKY